MASPRTRDNLFPVTDGLRESISPLPDYRLFSENYERKNIGMKRIIKERNVWNEENYGRKKHVEKIEN